MSQSQIDIEVKRTAFLKRCDKKKKEPKSKGFVSADQMDKEKADMKWDTSKVSDKMLGSIFSFKTCFIAIVLTEISCLLFSWP